MKRFDFPLRSPLGLRTPPAQTRQKLLLLLHELAMGCAGTSCGARTALESRPHGHGEDSVSSDGSSASARPDPSTSEAADRGSPTPTGTAANGTPSTSPTSEDAFTSSPDATIDGSNADAVTLAPNVSDYTLPFTVVGKSQAESALYHPLPTDGTLSTTVDWLEEGEGLLYPLRYVDWTLVGEYKGEILAVGPTDEIYVQPYSAESRLIERYAPGYGWTTEAIHTRPDGMDVLVQAISVAPDGVAWAATDEGLFVRDVAGKWSRAVGWDPAIAVDGLDFSLSPTTGVAFRIHDVFTTSGDGVWAAVVRELPLLGPNIAYQREWRGFRANGKQLLGHSDVDVVWVDGSGSGHAYPIRARGVGFGAAGERLVLGQQELLVSDNADEWRVYPIHVGGHRGGPSVVEAMAVTSLGDAYVSGMKSALFHRFSDGSMEYLNTPTDSEFGGANGSVVVVRDAIGVWQATPRAAADTSGAFEAVVPRTYHGSFTSKIDSVELPFSVEPPSCFDTDIEDAVDSEPVLVDFGSGQRLRFRAPETGTFQFRVDWTTASGTLATYPARVSIAAECEPSTRAEGNPLHVALSVGQYVLIEASRGEHTPGERSEQRGWLSIQ